jgi:cytochrome c biogenesis protein CcmG, thiol:disulfide interchange protein DsbE
MDDLIRKIIYGVVLTLCLIWIFFSRVPAGSPMTDGITAPHQGFHAPDLTLTTLDGNTISLSDFRGQPVILNFWATWCPPCRAEMPVLQQVFQDYKETGLMILTVNSTAHDSPSAVQNFVSEYNLAIPILLDDQGKATKNYQVSSLPTTYFIDRDGVIHEIVVGGPMADALLRSRVDGLLEGTP